MVQTIDMKNACGVVIIQILNFFRPINWESLLSLLSHQQKLYEKSFQIIDISTFYMPWLRFLNLWSFQTSNYQQNDETTLGRACCKQGWYGRYCE